MVDAFLGKIYKLESNENLDQFLTAIGVDILVRTVQLMIKPKIQLAKYDDGEYCLGQHLPIENKYIRFRLGEELEETSINGFLGLKMFTIEGTTLREIFHVPGKEMIITTDRTFSSDQLVSVSTYNGITATRIYRAEN